MKAVPRSTSSAKFTAPTRMSSGSKALSAAVSVSVGSNATTTSSTETSASKPVTLSAQDAFFDVAWRRRLSTTADEAALALSSVARRRPRLQTRVQPQLTSKKVMVPAAASMITCSIAPRVRRLNSSSPHVSAPAIVNVDVMVATAASTTAVGGGVVAVVVVVGGGVGSGVGAVGGGVVVVVVVVGGGVGSGVGAVGGGVVVVVVVVGGGVGSGV